MNLENLYGNQESLMKVFEQAIQQNEPIEVFFRLASIYETSQKLDVSPLCMCVGVHASLH